MEHYTETIDGWVTGGFRSHADLEENLRDIAADDEDDVDPDAVVAELDRRWDARVAEQASWPAVTDSDRLDAAFAALEAAGVAARMDYSCCGTCAPGELAEEVGNDPGKRGYVYFHAQDAEGIAHGSVCLGYGSLADCTIRGRLGRRRGWDHAAYEIAAVAIGHEIADAVRRQGLAVDWNGSHEARIAVTGLDWRRRLAPRVPG